MTSGRRRHPLQTSGRADAALCWVSAGFAATFASGLRPGKPRITRPQRVSAPARGGQRSHIVQRWLQENRIDCPLIEGGYKALRQTAPGRLRQLAQNRYFLIGGCTGSGKTQLVRQQPNGADLKVSRVIAAPSWPHAETPAQPCQF